MNRPRRYLSGIRALIVLVACCAVFLWTGRVVWQSLDPLRTDAIAVQGRALRTLQSRNAPERVAAIRDLAQLDLAENVIAIPPLIKILEDEDPEARAAAAQALGRIVGDAVQNGYSPARLGAAVTAISSLLKDSQPNIRIAAAQSLVVIASAEPGAAATASSAPAATAGKSVPSLPRAKASTPIDNTTIAALTEALSDRDAGVRGAVVVALAAAGSAGAPSVEPPKFFAAMLEDEAAENRKANLRILLRYRHGLDSWIPSLLKIAEHDSDPSVRAAYLKAITQEIQPPVITHAAVPALIAGLGSRDWQIRISITNLLAKLGRDAEEAIPTLYRFLLEPIDDDETDRANERQNLAWAAAFAIWRIEPESVSTPETVTALTRLVRSGHHLRKGQAAWMLGNLGSEAAAAIPALIEMAREAGDKRSFADEAAAAKALGLIAPETPATDEVVTVLLAVLKSNSPASRVTAILALQRLGPKAASAIPTIRALRDDPDFNVQRVATSALAALEAP